MALGMSLAVFSFFRQVTSFNWMEILKTAQGSENKLGALPPRGPSASTCSSTHRGLPAEDVAVETDPVLREVEAALEEDLPLQGAGVI